MIKGLVQKLFSWYPSPLLINFLDSDLFSNLLSFFGQWEKMLRLIDYYSVQSARSLFLSMQGPLAYFFSCCA